MILNFKKNTIKINKTAWKKNENLPSKFFIYFHPCYDQTLIAKHFNDRSLYTKPFYVNLIYTTMREVFGEYLAINHQKPLNLAVFSRLLMAI